MLALVLIFSASLVHAEDKKVDVLALMDKAVAHFEAVGQAAAFQGFSKDGGEYKFGEYYIVAQHLDTDEIVFHATNERLVGKNLMKVKDTDGKMIAAEMTKVVRTMGKCWVDFNWPHPLTKKLHLSTCS
ncbi:MAG: cache domain-containing protein [Sneathiella sp.]